MAGITEAQAQAHLDAWMAADLAVAQGQSYSIGSRTLTRADAAKIQEKIAYWNGIVQRFARRKSGPLIRMSRFVPK